MVLNELGQKISDALARVAGDGGAGGGGVDEAAVDACLKDICTALLQADVNVRLVSKLRASVKAAVASADKGAALNKRKVVEKAVVDGLAAMLDPRAAAGAAASSTSGGGGGPASSSSSASRPIEPKRGRTTVVMFVGLQGAGKTTTCCKYASHYKRKGWSPGLVCADTFRAGAFDQLKQNATKAGIPFYGSYDATDPATIAAAGVAKFREERRDLIIVDTSGRHRQEEALFEEMRQVAAAVAPDLVVFVMDGSIGQAAYDQAAAFRAAVDVGAVILTKMDGHARGGGALAAVAATSAPIAFLGTGEHLDELERFEAKSFVGRLLGRGDWKGFVDRIADAVPPGGEAGMEAVLASIQAGRFTLRLMYDQFAALQRMGPLNQVMGMIPGLSGLMGGAGGAAAGADKASALKMRRSMTIMDSMTDEELDAPTPKLMTQRSRIMRIARGSGRPPAEVQDLVEEYCRMRAMVVGGPKGQGGLAKALGALGGPGGLGGGGGGGRGGMPNPAALAQMQAQVGRMLPPGMLAQMGGAGGLAGLLKSMEGLK